MRISHRFATAGRAQRLERQAALHRKCLLLLRERARRAAAPGGGR